jgi:glucoamylase
MPALHYERVQAALPQTSVAAVAPYLLQLMVRNIATDGFAFVDPTTAGSPAPRVSRPGCVIASPSYPATLTSIDQNYVHHWVRDAAITVMELAHQPLALQPGAVDQRLCDYVAFSKACRDNTPPESFYRAAYQIDGTPRPWTDQKDGPALQNLAFVDALPLLDDTSRATAKALAQVNLDRIVADWSDDSDKYNPWEEAIGPSFFARAVQLRCLREVQGTNTLGLTPPADLAAVVSDLAAALDSHWDAGAGHYVSVLGATLPPGSPSDLSGYDPNSDVVSACAYGAVPCTDPRLLATAAKVRATYEAGGACAYPINAADDGLDMGPLIGRYPSDVYDGNVGKDRSQPTRGHPWALCTANFAELYYRVAKAFESAGGVGHDGLTAQFFDQVGLAAEVVNDAAQGQSVAQRLRAAGDRMLRAIIYHSDHYELSEQFDATTGYEKSVTNLTWSYAAYLSAVRAR